MRDITNLYTSCAQVREDLESLALHDTALGGAESAWEEAVERIALGVPADESNNNLQQTAKREFGDAGAILEDERR